jgi:hypothetical protein
MLNLFYLRHLLIVENKISVERNYASYMTLQKRANNTYRPCRKVANYRLNHVVPYSLKLSLANTSGSIGRYKNVRAITVLCFATDCNHYSDKDDCSSFPFPIAACAVKALARWKTLSSLYAAEQQPFPKPEWELPGGWGSDPQFNLQPPDPYFYELGVGSNPPSWPQLSVYSCARAPTTLVLAKQYVSRQTSVK